MNKGRSGKYAITGKGIRRERGENSHKNQIIRNEDDYMKENMNNGT